MMTHKRHKKDSALARTFRARLEELRNDRKYNYSEFAKAAAIGRTSVNAWRNSGSIPRGDFVRDLAQRFGVTTDWLLGIPGAPKFRGQVRERPELEADLASYVAREIAAAYSVDASDIEVSGKRLLRAAARAGLRQVRRDAAGSLRNVLALPAYWLAKLVPSARDREKFLGALRLYEIQPPSKLQGARVAVTIRKSLAEARRQAAEITADEREEVRKHLEAQLTAYRALPSGAPDDRSDSGPSSP